MAEENQMDRPSAVSPQVEEKAKRGVTHAHKAAADVSSAAGAMTADYRAKTEEAWGEAKDRVRTFREDADQYVRKNPTRAVFTALGIGFVMGLIFRR